MANIVIIGAGDQGECTLDVLQRAGEHRVIGFLDDARQPGEHIADLPVLGGVDDIADARRHVNFDAVVIAIGDNHRRTGVAETIRRLDPHVGFATAIDPTASIGGDVEIGEGTVIQAGTVLNRGARVGRHVLLCVRSSLDHHSTMADGSSLAPNVATGGRVHIGVQTAIGIGATISHGRTVGDHTVIGAGSTVVRDIVSGVVAMGTPCRSIRPRSVDEPYL